MGQRCRNVKTAYVMLYELKEAIGQFLSRFPEVWKGQTVHSFSLLLCDAPIISSQAVRLTGSVHRPKGGEVSESSYNSSSNMVCMVTKSLFWWTLIRLLPRVLAVGRKPPQTSCTKFPSAKQHDGSDISLYSTDETIDLRLSFDRALQVCRKLGLFDFRFCGQQSAHWWSTKQLHLKLKHCLRNE